MINNSYNFLSNDYRDKMNQMDQVDEIANLLKSSGASRAERRRIEKAISKTTKISEKTHKKLMERAYNEYKYDVDTDFVHFNSILGLVMYEEYGWEETDDNEQITELFTKIQEKMMECKEKNMTTTDITDKLYDLTGIRLVSENDPNKDRLIREFEEENN